MDQNCPVCLENLRPVFNPHSAVQHIHFLTQFQCMHYMHKNCFQDFFLSSLQQQNFGELVLSCPICRAKIDRYARVTALHDRSSSPSSFESLAHYVHSLLPSTLQRPTPRPLSPIPPSLQDLPSSSDEDEAPTARDLEEGLDLDEPFERPQTMSVQTSTQNAFIVRSRGPFRAPRRTARRGRVPYDRDPSNPYHRFLNGEQ